MKINLKDMNGGLGSVHMHHHAQTCTHTHTCQVCHKDSDMSSKSQSSLHATNTFHTKMKQFKFLKSEARNEVRRGTFISPLITTIYDKKSSMKSKTTSA